MILDERALSAAMVTVFTLSVGAWSWLMRRWVVKVDALHRDVASLERQAAVRDERMTHLVGALEILRKTVSDQSATVGVLANAVDKLWIVLEARGLVQARPSDDILRGKRTKS